MIAAAIDPTSTFSFLVNSTPSPRMERNHA